MNQTLLCLLCNNRKRQKQIIKNNKVCNISLQQKRNILALMYMWKRMAFKKKKGINVLLQTS